METSSKIGMRKMKIRSTAEKIKQLRPDIIPLRSKVGKVKVMKRAFGFEVKAVEE